jgi:hypothetical protein
MAGERGSEIRGAVPSMAGEASSGRRCCDDLDGREIEGVTVA